MFHMFNQTWDLGLILKHGFFPDHFLCNVAI